MPHVEVENVHALKDFAGREIAVTDWLLMTQERIDRFAEASEGSGFTWIVNAPKRNRPMRLQSAMVS